MKKEDDKSLERISEILVDAIRRENEAFNYYYRSSDNSPFPETRSLLLQLAGEERKHRMILVRELQTLKGFLKRAKKGEEFIRKDEISYQLPDELPYRKIQAIPKIDVAAVTLPSQLTGGDYFDIFPVQETSQVVFLFDVAGHGLGATELKGQASSVFERFKESYLEARVSPDAFAPSSVARMLNQKLWETCQKKAVFLTMFYALFNPEDKKLSYVSAGQEPPILLKKGKSQPEIIDSDLLIGVDKEQRYPGNKVNVDSGDIFILFSDGLVETFAFRDVAFRRDELVDVVRRRPELNSKEIVERICEFAKSKLQGKTLTDEFTLAVFKIK